MTYLEHITTYVVSLVGKGVALSSSDLQVVRGWEAAGVPPETACRAIQRAWRRAGAARSRRRLVLADCRLPSADPSAAAAPATPDQHPGAFTATALLTQLERVGRACDDATLKAVYRTLYRHTRALPQGVTLALEVLARLDAMAIRELERQLPPQSRRAARASVRRRARRLAGPEARREAIERLAQVLLQEHYCARQGLLLPSDLLLDGGRDDHPTAVHRLRE